MFFYVLHQFLTPLIAQTFASILTTVELSNDHIPGLSRQVSLLGVQLCSLDNNPISGIPDLQESRYTRLNETCLSETFTDTYTYTHPSLSGFGVKASDTSRSHDNDTETSIPFPRIKTYTKPFPCLIGWGPGQSIAHCRPSIHECIRSQPANAPIYTSTTSTTKQTQPATT
jgi:hypothetical protein